MGRPGHRPAARRRLVAHRRRQRQRLFGHPERQRGAVRRAVQPAHATAHPVPAGLDRRLHATRQHHALQRQHRRLRTDPRRAARLPRQPGRTRRLHRPGARAHHLGHAGRGSGADRRCCTSPGRLMSVAKECRISGIPSLNVNSLHGFVRTLIGTGCGQSRVMTVNRTLFRVPDSVHVRASSGPT